MANWVASWLLEHPEYNSLPVFRRARHAIHFLRPDGKIEMLVVGKPMHFESAPGSGNYDTPIDTDLRDIGGGVLSGLGTPAQIETDGAVSVKGSAYKQRPARVVRFRPSTNGVSNIATIPGNGTASGDTLTRSGTGWTYTVRITEDGAGQELVLAQAPSFPGGTRDTDYICIEEELTGHSLPDGEVSTEMDIAGMRFPLPTAWDVNGDSPVTRRWALTSGGKQYLYTGVPVSWLNSAAYPVVVDPDFAGDTADGYIIGSNSAYATARSTSTSFNTNENAVWIGQYPGPYTIQRAYLKFDTSSIGADSTVTQANLKLVCTTNQSATDFDVNIIKQDWSAQDPIGAANREAAYDNCLTSAEDDAIWRNTAGMSTNTQYTSGNLSNAWVSKTGSTYYSLPSNKDYDGSGTAPTTYDYILIASANHATEAYRPVLTVLYSAGGADVNASASESATVSETVTLSVASPVPSVSDTVTVGETVVARVSDLAVGVSDAVTVAESVSALVHHGKAPHEVTGLKVWYKADALALNDDDAVTTWADSSGNGIDVAQSTAANKPTFKTGIRNNQPIVRFDGGDFLTKATVSGSSLTGASEADIFLVFNQTGSKATNTQFMWEGGIGGNNRLGAHLTYSDVLYFDHGDTAAGGRINGAQPTGWDDVWHIVELFRSASSGDAINVDDAAAVNGSFTDDLDTTQAVYWTIGASWDGATANDHFQGDIAELFLYNVALSEADRRDVLRYLSGKYGIVAWNPYASDTVTVSESVSVSVSTQADFSVSVSDSMSVSESVAVSLPDALAVSVSDSVTASETVGISLPGTTLSASVSDSVAVSDSPTARVGTPKLRRTTSGLVLTEDFSDISDWGNEGTWAVNTANPALIAYPITGRYFLEATAASNDAGGVRESHVLVEGSTLYQFYGAGDGTGGAGGPWRVQLAKSTDGGKTWTKPGVQVALAKDFEAGNWAARDNLFVHKVGSTYYLHVLDSHNVTSNVPTSPYESSVYTASSPEGPWTYDSRAITLGTAGEWDDTDAYSGSVVLDDATYHLFYSGKNSSNVYQIGRATSSNPDGPWTKQGEVLPAGTKGQPENPKVWWDTRLNRWVMFCNQVNTGAGLTDTNSIFLSTSLTDWSGAVRFDIQQRYIYGTTAASMDSDGQVVGLGSPFYNADGTPAYDGVYVPFSFDGWPTDTNHVGRRIKAGVLEPAINNLRYSAGATTQSIQRVIDNDDFIAEFALIFESTTEPSGQINFQYRRENVAGEANNTYSVLFQAGTGGDASVQLYKRVAGTWTQIASNANMKPALGRLYRVRVEASGNSHAVYIDGVQILTATDSAFSSGASFAFRGYDCTARIYNFSVRTGSAVTISSSNATVNMRSHGSAYVADDTASISSNHYPMSELVVDGVTTEPENNIWGGDAYTYEMALVIGVSESITITETVSAVAADLLPSTSDAVTLSDTVVVSITTVSTLEASVSDNVTLAETVIATPLQLLASATETITVADIPAPEPLALNATAAETVTVSETVALTPLSVAASVSDGASVTESVTADLPIAASAQDAVTVGELISTTVPDLPASASDSIALTETVSVALAEAGGISLSVSDAVAVAETVTAVGGDLPAAASEAVAVAETVAALADLNPIVSEAVAVAETVAAQVSDLGVAATDAVAVAETVTGMVDLNPTAAESVTASETVASAVSDPAVQVSEAVAITEAVSLSLPVLGELTIDVSETVGTAEAVTAQVADLLVEALESIGVAETVAAVAGALPINVSESVAVAESVEATTSACTLAVSDSVLLAETVALQVDLSAVATDTVGVGEDLAATIDLGLGVSEAITLAELIGSLVGDGVVSVSEAIAVAESVIASMAAAGTLTLADVAATVFTLTDARAATLTLADARAATLTLTDASGS